MEWLVDLWTALTHLHTIPYTPQDVIMKAMCHFTFGFMVGSLALPLWAVLVALDVIAPIDGRQPLRDRFNALIAFPLRVMTVSAMTNVLVDVDHLSLLFGPRDDHGRMLHGLFFLVGASIALSALIQFFRLLRRPNDVNEAVLKRYIFCGFVGFSAAMHVFQDSLKNWWF